MLLVFYLQKRFVATAWHHSLDCFNPCHNGFCRRIEDSRLKDTYAVRFTFQSLLTIDLSGGTTYAHKLLRQLKAALAILRGVEILKQLESDQLRFYSTCTDNPIFNDAPSAILSEAVGSYLGTGFLTRLAEMRGTFQDTTRYEVHPPMFWVALSACVLGDLQLFERCLGELTLPINESSSQGPTDLLLTKQPVALLIVAIKYAKLNIVNRLLETNGGIISERHPDHVPLRAAIFSQNNRVLKALLKYTPSLPELLTQGLKHYPTLLPLSSEGSETIRLLTKHFTPLAPESRAWLIVHSCAVGDVTLLEEFSNMEPLFSHRVDDACGRIPTYLHFAIRCGNIDSLRFLLDHGVVKTQRRQSLRMAMEQALSFNQIECYRALYQHVDPALREPYFSNLALAENSEDIMTEFISDYGRDLVFDWGKHMDEPIPTAAQRALWNAIQRLRPGNVRFFLGAGVRVFPSQHAKEHYEIPWPYFNQNRDAFRRTEAVLNAFKLPKLQILV